MGLSDENRKNLIDLYWEKSVNCFSDMEFCAQSGKWGMAANRIYYSVFYALSALFIKDGLSIKSHRGAKALLGQYYILTNKIDQKYSRLFAQLETLRDKADYDVSFTATQDEVDDFRNDTVDFLKVIKNMLGK